MEFEWVKKLLMCLFLLALPAWSDPDVEFKAGNACMDQKNYKAALEKYQSALKEAPGSPAILFNAGLAAYLSAEYGDSIQLFQELKRLQPDDWRARAKLIQAYQAAGKSAECDRERDALLELKKSAGQGELKSQKTFVRDQFVVGGRRVFASEHFALEGERALLYSFTISRPNSDELEKFRVSLGSYDATTRFMRESKQIGPEDRVYHLDYYAGGEHRTYRFYTRRPSYDEVRQSLSEILEGKLQPISSSKTGEAK